MNDHLPIDHVLSDVVAALETEGRAVLQAPPGAGKTTKVPLALLNHVKGKIIMLEPRRLAARAAAERLAELLGERPGGQVGYRMRGESIEGSRIEVVTDGILTRIFQTDPELSGIGALIFDEFHERALNSDLGLALAQEVREALRPDLKLLVMSATLDAAPVAEYLGNAPLITSQGRSFDVEHRYLARPLPRETRFETEMAELVRRAIAETKGGVLVFLPGEGEIRRVERLLGDLPGCTIMPLFGSLPIHAQRAVIAPSPAQRKVVLATSIAETSLTIEDIRVVVDGGMARRARFDPGSGMSRLVTERASKAEVIQRAGRAGRMAPGIAYKLWARAEDGAMTAFPPAQIEAADLCGLALELAAWGRLDLPLLTPAPVTALAEARALLEALGATRNGSITTHGKTIAAMPLHPRLGHMLALGGASAAPLAALLAERDVMRQAPADLSLRIRALAGKETPYQADRVALTRARAEAKRLRSIAPKRAPEAAQLHAARAYPDRIAKRRKGDMPRYILSGGKGAVLSPGDPMALAPFLVITDTDGNPREATIRTALPISLAEIHDVAGHEIVEEKRCFWSKQHGQVRAHIRERLGAITLSEKRWPDPGEDLRARAMLEGVRLLGLFPNPAADRFRARVAALRPAHPDLPDLSTAALLDTLEHWALPYLGNLTTAADWKDFDLLPALQSILTWAQTELLNREAPPHFTTPLGRKVPIDYSGEHPEISLRLQEMFGTTIHPKVAGRPLRVTFLSPGNKPIQTTIDIPGFWVSSYADLRKDMRGRYPRHPWPEDPSKADPTLRAKARKN